MNDIDPVTVKQWRDAARVVRYGSVTALDHREDLSLTALEAMTMLDDLAEAARAPSRCTPPTSATGSRPRCTSSTPRSPTAGARRRAAPPRPRRPGAGRWSLGPYTLPCRTEVPG